MSAAFKIGDLVESFNPHLGRAFVTGLGLIIRIEDDEKLMREVGEYQYDVHWFDINVKTWEYESHLRKARKHV